MSFLLKYRQFQVIRPFAIAQCHSSSLQAGPEGVRIPGIPQRFSYLWLRDSCQCPQCVHPSTKQKLHESSFVHPHVRPQSGEDSVKLTPEGDLAVDWDAKFDFTGSPHTSVYSRRWLERYASPTKLKAFHRDLDAKLWDVADVEESEHLFVSYRGLKDRPTLLKAMQHFIRYGLIFIRGVPSEHTGDTSCELQTLATIFGEIRETFYGRVWDVRNVKNSKNIAYTDLHLDLHMDLLYFQHPPRYQILHCLRNRVQGGESIFVDAFKAAAHLYRQSPDSFDLLATHPVGFHYLNDSHHLHQLHTTFVLAPPYLFPLSAGNPVGGTPALDHINYSPPFQAPLPVNAPPEFFAALAQFSELLKRPGGRYVYRLQEGDAVLFDNRRVLHARAAFREWQDHERPKDVPQTREGESSRWLKGCYLEADALLDRMRVLQAQLGMPAREGSYC